MPSNKFENLVLANHCENYSEIFEISDYRIGVFNSKSKVREVQENEDALFVTLNKNVIRLGVADGAGGHPRGKDAATEIVMEMRAITTGNPLEHIELANEKVKDLKAGAKATLAMAQIENSKVVFHAVGDSEIIYWNSLAREVYSSIPHSIVGAKVEAGLTTQEESLSDPERHIVTNMMGDDFVRISSTSTMELKKGHTILVGTDGVFDNISHEKLGEIVAKGAFDDSFEELAKICTEQNEQDWLKFDDIAFILLRKIKS